MTGEYKREDQTFLAIVDARRGYHTWLSQYASAEAEINSDELIGIERMSLGPSGTSHLRERMVKSKDESRSAATDAKEDVIPNIPGPLQT